MKRRGFLLASAALASAAGAAKTLVLGKELLQVQATRPAAGASAALGPDGGWAEAVASENTLRAFDAHGDERWQLTSTDGERRDLNGPTALAYGPDGSLYVADRGNGRVLVLDAAGKQVRTIGQRGAEPHPRKVESPAGLTVGESGEVYVTDSRQHCVHVFDAGGSWQRSFGRTAGDATGTGKKSLNGPLGLTLDEAAGQVHVVDAGNTRVQVYDQGGRWVRSYGGDTLKLPRDVQLVDGRAHVSDVAGAQLVVFDAGGRLLDQRAA